MAKESFYFRHDYNARNDDKVLELRSKFGAEGYGVFWMIVETMAENEDGGVKASLIGGLSLGYGVAKDRLLEVILYCLEIGLFYEESGCYYSKRLLTHKEFRKSLSQFGASGAAKRWGGYSHPNAKERKGKENKAISLDEENLTAIFIDGSKQPLGTSQTARLKFKDLKPTDVIKGQIV
jgi:hypothetical protein